jgi:hypothetical protein
MTAIIATAAAAALLLSALEADAQTEKSADKARAALETYLAKVPGAQAGRVVAATGDAVARAFPDRHFFAVRFRGYPVKPPGPFKTNNLFAVAADGTIRHLKDDKDLKEFFRSSLSPVSSDAEAKTACEAWLRLAEELHQDGYYAFTLVNDSVQVHSRDGTRLVSGKARVTEGGEGQVSATLSFDRGGKLAEASTEAALKPGARPAGARPGG